MACVQSPRMFAKLCSSSVVAFLRILVFIHWSYSGVLVFGQDIKDEDHHQPGDHGTMRPAVNITEGPMCPPHKDCDSVAAVVIGSLIGGAIIGSVVTFIVMKCLVQRPVAAPPKDYNDLYDENRNNGNNGTETSEGYEMAGVDLIGGQDRTNSHRKLERLAKPAHALPVDIKIPSAATPLIPSVEGISTDSPEPGAVDGSTGTGDNSQAGGPGVYTNLKEMGTQEQPYDSLDIIPEEVEYENTRTENYERLSSQLQK